MDSPGTDRNDWSAWVDLHGSALLLYARQIVAAEDAEDVVQEAFIRFWRARRAEQSGPELTAYMYTCVKSCALDYRRGQKRRVERELNAQRGGATPQETHPADALQREERLRAVDLALARLPEEQRELFVMKTCTALSFAQIGQVLKISANTAASRYRYACETLRAKLAREVTP